MALNRESQDSLPQKAARVLRTFAANPVAVARSLPGEVLQKHGSLWFLDESYVVSRKRD